MGIIGMFSYITGAVVPHTLTVMSSVFSDDPDLVWPSLFILVSCVCVLANTVFIIFGTTEVQEWNHVQPECRGILNVVNCSLDASDEKLNAKIMV